MANGECVKYACYVYRIEVWVMSMFYVKALTGLKTPISKKKKKTKKIK
jgi:hypothetical protein